MVSVPTPSLGDCVLGLDRLAGSAALRQNVSEMVAPIVLRTPASTEANGFTRVRMEAGQQWRTPTDPTQTPGASDPQDRTVCHPSSPSIRIDACPSRLPSGSLREALTAMPQSGLCLGGGMPDSVSDQSAFSNEQKSKTPKTRISA